MNTKLVTMSLAALLALSPLGTASADKKTDDEHNALKNSHAQMQSTHQSLAATARSLRDQRKALILQLNTLNPAATNSQWNALFAAYDKIADDPLVAGDQAALSREQKAYLRRLMAVTPAGEDSVAFQNQVVAILSQLEALLAQEDALAAAMASHKSEKAHQAAAQKSNNGLRGK